MKTENVEKNAYNGLGRYRFWFITDDNRPAYIYIKDSTHMTIWLGEKGKPPAFGRPYVEMVKLIRPEQAVGEWYEAYSCKLEGEPIWENIQKRLEKVQIKID